MKRITLTIIIVTLLSFTLIYSFLYIKDLRKVEHENNIDGKNISQEEYIYKEDLLYLAYKVDEIKKIEETVNNIDVKRYLLNHKYDNLINFLNVPYFKCENIERYENYLKRNKELSYEEIVLNVEMNLDKDFYTNITEVKDPNDTLVLVNKFYKLPNNFEATDLELVDSKYGKNQVLKKITAKKVIEMIEAAKKDNINLTIVSSYRSESKQQNLFNTTKKKYGQTYALNYQAKPGHSEHQTGYAVDLNTTNSNFSKTKEYEWLKNNAHIYGFIERYPKGKTKITGYGYEPWHYRYVGIDVSTKIHENNITLEEYLIKYSK